MKNNVVVAQKMFETLAKKKINIMVISTSEIKISVLIALKKKKTALIALHNVYGLDKKENWKRIQKKYFNPFVTGDPIF